MQQAHLSALETKHAGLDARIAEEIQRPHPDDTLLSRLKKEKLRLKEAIRASDPTLPPVRRKGILERTALNDFRRRLTHNRLAASSGSTSASKAIPIRPRLIQATLPGTGPIP
jgi:hypothetical protein